MTLAAVARADQLELSRFHAVASARALAVPLLNSRSFSAQDASEMHWPVTSHGFG
jgi:hypothetical protein